jgi:hypothetical protein
MNRHHDGYWVGFADIRVLLEWNGYMRVLAKQQRYGSMIDENQGVHLVGSERYACATWECQTGI